MTGPTQASAPTASLNVAAPMPIWALVAAAIFHANRERQADDPEVIVLEGFLGRLVAGLETRGFDPELIDLAIATYAVCEHCGCAPHRSCEGGCEWSPAHAAAERYVCSRCPSKVPAPGEDPRGAAGGLILPGDARFTLPGCRP